MQSKETEFKNILNAEQFHAIAKQYQFQPPFKQTNVYFDTNDEALHQHHMGMRIRLFADYAEQTVKTPSPQHIDHQLIETTDKLTVQQANDLIKANKIYTGGAVAKVLQQHHINITDLKIIARATTTRQLALLPAGLLTLDQTDYPNGKSDYELEMEFNPDNYTLSSHFFYNLLNDFHISESKMPNKIARAIANQ